MQFKCYVPDRGLADIIVLNDYEFRTFFDQIDRCDYMEANHELKERKQLLVEELQTQSRTVPIYLDDKQDLFKCLKPFYEITENLAVFIRKSIVTTLYPYKIRYEKLKYG